MILKIIGEFVKILKDDANPTQVGLGVAFGFLMAFQPVTLLSTIFFIIFFVIKINKGAGFLSLALFKLLALALEPGAVLLGSFVLTLEPLYGIFSQLRNMPIVPLTRFYNTAVMGGLLIGLIGFVPVTILFKQFYIWYRDNFRKKIIDARWFKAFKALPLVNIFFKASELINNKG